MRVVWEDLVDEVHGGYHHPSAAVAGDLELVQGLALVLSGLDLGLELLELVTDELTAGKTAYWD